MRDVYILMSARYDRLPSDPYVWRKIMQYLPDAVDRANLRESCKMLAQLIDPPSNTDTALCQYVARGRDPSYALSYRDANGKQIEEILSFDDAVRNRAVTERRARIIQTLRFAAVRAPLHLWQRICAISPYTKMELDRIHFINVLREIWHHAPESRAPSSRIHALRNEYEIHIGDVRHIFCFSMSTLDEWILRALDFAENMSQMWHELRDAIGFPRDTSPEMIFAISRSIFRSSHALWKLWLQWYCEQEYYCAENVSAFRKDRAQLAARKHIRFSEDIAFSAQQLRNMRAMRDQRFIRAAIEAIRTGVFRTIVSQMSHDLDIARTVWSIYDWNKTSGDSPYWPYILRAILRAQK